MPNLLERVEELHRRVTELEQTVKANDEKRHFGEGELRGYNQALERAVLDLEQRVSKPIPVVEPLASGDDLEELARDCFDRWRVDCSYRISDCERDVMLILARARVAKAGP